MALTLLENTNKQTKQTKNKTTETNGNCTGFNITCNGACWSTGNWSPSIGSLLKPLNPIGICPKTHYRKPFFLMVLMIKSWCFVMFVIVFVVCFLWFWIKPVCHRTDHSLIGLRLDGNHGIQIYQLVMHTSMWCNFCHTVQQYLLFLQFCKG